MDKTLEKYNYYIINLNTPYKWGAGYSDASEEEITSNEFALKEIMRLIGFELYDNPEKSCWGCNIYYSPENLWEEIYLHPMEITGTLKNETVTKIVKFLTENEYPFTKLDAVKAYDEERKYTFEEVIERYNSIDEEIFKKMYKKNYGVLAMNDNLEELGFKFKRYTFCKLIDSDTKLQKDFLIRSINEKFKSYRNKGM